MSENDQKPETKGSARSPSETGNTSLVAGAGIGAYGTAMAVTAGYICPFCVVAAPALLGLGAYQKYKFHKAKKR